MVDISQELEKIDVRESELLRDHETPYDNPRYGPNCGTISSPINDHYLTGDNDEHLVSQSPENYYDKLPYTMSASTQKLRVKTKEAFKVKTQSTSNLR